MSSGWGPEVWVLIVGSGVLALALPLVSTKMAARQKSLEQLYLSSRPATVLGSLVLLTSVVGVAGAGAVVLAFAYPFMWATAALCASGSLSIALIAVAFVRAARRRRSEFSSSEGDGGR